MVFQWFPMVANHWSDDGMVTIHRSGLIGGADNSFVTLLKLRYLHTVDGKILFHNTYDHSEPKKVIIALFTLEKGHHPQGGRSFRQ